MERRTPSSVDKLTCIFRTSLALGQGSNSGHHLLTFTHSTDHDESVRGNRQPMMIHRGIRITLGDRFPCLALYVVCEHHWGRLSRLPVLPYAVVVVDSV